MLTINAILFNIFLFFLIILFILSNTNPLSSILVTRSRQPDETDENAVAASQKSKSRSRKSKKVSEHGNYFVIFLLCLADIFFCSYFFIEQPSVLA